MVWDQGDWTPLGDVDQGLKDGHLKFELHGKKLKGAVGAGPHARTRRRVRRREIGKANWLLIKEKDEFARESSDEAITEEAPDSAASGRTMEEIAARKGRVWNSDRRKCTSRQSNRCNPTEVKRSRCAAGSRKAAGSCLAPNARRTSRHAPRERFPGFIAPQLALQTSSPPTGDDWVHELKLDGYRIQIQISPAKETRVRKPAKVRLLTRKGLDWTARMPDIAAAAAKLSVKDAILDGEAVALDEHGVSNFADLQAAFQEGRQRYITYFAFDLLHLDGHNLRGLPLLGAKADSEQFARSDR